MVCAAEFWRQPARKAQTGRLSSELPSKHRWSTTPGSKTLKHHSRSNYACARSECGDIKIWVNRCLAACIRDIQSRMHALKSPSFSAFTVGIPFSQGEQIPREIADAWTLSFRKLLVWPYRFVAPSFAMTRVHKTKYSQRVSFFFFNYKILTTAELIRRWRIISFLSKLRSYLRGCTFFMVHYQTQEEKISSRTP